MPAFWTNADSAVGLFFAPVLRWFGLSTSLEKRLPPDYYLPQDGAAKEPTKAAQFLADMNRDDSRLVKRITFRALDEANKLSKMALRNRPVLPVTVFFDNQDGLVKQPKSKEALANLGVVTGTPTNSGHGVQVIAPGELASALHAWIEQQLPAH